MTTEKKSQYLGIGCPPGYPRPTHLLPQVLEGTGIPTREPISTFFGDFTWDYSDIPEEQWEKARELIGPRLRKLDKEGVTRWASW